MTERARKNSSFNFPQLIVLICLFALLWFGYKIYQKYIHENMVLKKMVERLQADSRIAEVLVTEVNFNSLTGKHMTTIKFLEYDGHGRPLSPKYFTFSGSLIQFQSLVVRFDDARVREADPLRGKSAYIFWKIFMLDGEATQEYEVNIFGEIPEGYKIPGIESRFEKELWENFWNVALDFKEARRLGIKNAQIEAPGTKFVPGLLYTLKIEHDGGIRIDAADIPQILKGEKVLN